MNTPAPTEDVAAALLERCSQIEALLRERHQMVRTHGLGAVVMEAIRLSDPTAAFYRDELMALAELQDVVLRSRSGGVPVAPPLPGTIARTDRLIDALDHPAPAIRFASGTLSRGTTGELLGPRLVEMHRRDFSQVPVYDSGVFAGMLTTHAVARWLADQLDEHGDGLIDRARVRDVLPYVEEHEVAVFVSQETPASAVVRQLLDRDPPLVVILTASGRETDPPLGLLTAADVPELLDVLAV